MHTRVGTYTTHTHTHIPPEYWVAATLQDLGFKLCYYIVKLRNTGSSWQLEPTSIPPEYPALVSNSHPVWDPKSYFLLRTPEPGTLRAPGRSRGWENRTCALFLPSFSGGVSLVPYDSLLHPRCTDIRQGFVGESCGVAGVTHQRESTLPDTALAGRGQRAQVKGKGMS